MILTKSFFQVKASCLLETRICSIRFAAKLYACTTFTIYFTVHKTTLLSPGLQRNQVCLPVQPSNHVDGIRVIQS
ncbi:hypothetical protein GIB67_003073 [Kingdonia uniflora]|uniref:Uncharacterized protein n=1 Tax=Kingdonia uniflora TaxID=39325 RepID=A0A7J7N5W9_9MAGN|nr:hypothetical protein GIB67_003073 [Kingdonia uniflora]